MILLITYYIMKKISIVAFFSIRFESAENMESGLGHVFHFCIIKELRCDKAMAMNRWKWSNNAMTMTILLDEAITQWRDGTMSMTQWCGIDDAISMMLSRAIFSSQSRYRHRTTAPMLYGFSMKKILFPVAIVQIGFWLRILEYFFKIQNNK